MQNLFYVGIVLAVVGIIFGIVAYATGMHPLKLTGGGALLIVLIGLGLAWYGRRSAAAV